MEQDKALIFDTPKSIQAYQAITLKHAIKLYARTGMKANRSYTPTNMLKAATTFTGRKYKRGQFELAISDLEDFIQSTKQAE